MKGWSALPPPISSDMMAPKRRSRAAPHRMMSSGFALRRGELDHQALALDMVELSRCSNATAKTTPGCERPFGNGWASAANRA